ncbi:hypothetical protein C1Y40_00225 [Mycobacterium talmoniae]|uniref:Uncharacterized protein n=1 Tax=Mycobacterium talmoniae TaxID=1858794 RepID=A0A2S8BSD4_9MYCO|nr:hypothetical protein C1Y40_00225 [Mycobacterium talmoniae]
MALEFFCISCVMSCWPAWVERMVSIRDFMVSMVEIIGGISATICGIRRSRLSMSGRMSSMSPVI